MSNTNPQLTVLVTHNPVQAAKQHAHIDQIIKNYRANKDKSAKGGMA